MNRIFRANVPGIRQALQGYGPVVAEVDQELRYLWIDAPHPDFYPATVAGKRDDELIGPGQAAQIMALKRRVFETKHAASAILTFNRSDGPISYAMQAYPVEDEGEIRTILTLAFPVPRPGEPSSSL